MDLQREFVRTLRKVPYRHVKSHYTVARMLRAGVQAYVLAYYPWHVSFVDNSDATVEEISMYRTYFRKGDRFIWMYYNERKIHRKLITRFHHKKV